jgi:hypothetical protein
MSSPAADTSPTYRQLRFLRLLSEETATSFVSPKTRGQASSEIKRLLSLKDSAEVVVADGDERELEALPVDGSDEQDEELVYATAVQAGEVSGFGSTASWRTGSSEQAVLEKPKVGELTELARYRVSGESRVLYGQRINGHVRITDRPASGRGRSYLVEGQLEVDGWGALKTLVRDYVEQARELNAVPIASSKTRRELELMERDA